MFTMPIVRARETIRRDFDVPCPGRPPFIPAQGYPAMMQPVKNDAIDMVLDVLKEEQERDVIARFGEKGFRFWRDALHRQRLLAPTVVGSVKGADGDCITIALGINGTTIVETDFDVNGGLASRIAATTAAVLVLGKSVDDAVALTARDVLTALETFPEEETHSAELAAAAVREAIHRWMIQAGRCTRELEADVRARFGENGLRIWTKAAQRPELAAPNAVGTLTGACGDTISIALRVQGERIAATDFDTDGCASSLIAAATAAGLAEGKTLDEAVDIDENAVVAAVGAFPDADRHCAYLATSALREAIHDWMTQHRVQNEPEKHVPDAASERPAD